MRRRLIVTTGVAAAVASLLACNALLGIDGDVIKPPPPDASAPEAPPPVTIFTSDDSGIAISVTADQTSVSQGGFIDFSITVQRDYAGTGPLRLRVASAYSGTSTKYPPTFALTSDAGVADAAGESEFEVFPAVALRVRLNLPVLAARGPATATFVVEDGDRRNELTQPFDIVGHIDSTYGTQQGVAILDQKVPDLGFVIGENQSNESPVVALLDGDRVVLAFEGTVFAHFTDAGVDPSFSKTSGPLQQVFDLGRLDSGLIGAAGTSLKLPSFMRVETDGGLSYNLLSTSKSPIRSATTANGATYGVVEHNNSVGRLLRFVGDDIDNVTPTTLNRLQSPNIVESDGDGLLMAGRHDEGTNEARAYVQRYDFDGGIKLAFGADGGTHIPDGTSLKTVERTPAGIYVGGSAGIPGLWRLDQNGVLDVGFGAAFAAAVRDDAAGKKVDGAVRALLRLPSGKLLVAGYLGFGKPDGFIGRVLPSGGIDTSFAPPTGRLRIDAFDGLDIRYLFPMPDGSVLAVAGMRNSTGLRIAFMRLVDVDQ